MIFRGILLIAGILASVTVFAQENPVDLSFDEALKMVLMNSSTLRARADEVEMDEYRIKQAKSEYFPKLDGYSSYMRTSLSSEIEFTNPLTGSISRISLFPEDRYNFGFQLSQDVYTFGKRGAKSSSARKGKTVSDLVRSDYKNHLFDLTGRTFASLLLARDNMIIQAANIERARKKLSIVEARIDQGRAAEYERLRARLLLIKYDESHLQAEEDFENAKIRLKSLLHWSHQYEFMPVGDLTALGIQIPESLGFQPDEMSAMKQAQLGYEISKNQQKVNRSAFFPGIGVFAKYDWQNGYQPDLNRIRGDWSVGVSVNWRILDGGLRRGRLSQARVESRRLNHIMVDLRERINSEHRSAVLAIETATEKLSMARERVRLAEEGLKIAESRYDQGLLPISDLLDLEIEKGEADLGLLMANFQLFLAKMDLKSSMEYYPELN